jgi:hypothetical protein
LFLSELFAIAAACQIASAFKGGDCILAMTSVNHHTPHITLSGNGRVMNRFDELADLVTIEDEGSLAAAALAALEERAGARLLEQLWLRRCNGCYPNIANQLAEFGHMEASKWEKTPASLARASNDFGSAPCLDGLLPHCSQAGTHEGGRRARF